MRRLALLFVIAVVWLAATGRIDWPKTALHFVELTAVKRPSVVLLAALFTGWVLGYFVGRLHNQFRAERFQNGGEARLSRALISRFARPDYHLMNHLTLRLTSGTTQVDHILVSRFGVFVIETKDYKGWIFANPRDRQWTQVLYRLKFRFQNPLLQNHLHVGAVRKLLDFLPPDAVRSVVVFTGDAVFKTDVPPGVFRINGAIDHIATQTTEVMTLNRVQFCVGRLESERLAVSKETDLEHVERLRRRHGSKD